jgi:hypothetical protein
MGLAADPRRIALGTRDQVWQFRNVPDLERHQSGFPAVPFVASTSRNDSRQWTTRTRNSLRRLRFLPRRFSLSLNRPLAQLPS